MTAALAIAAGVSFAFACVLTWRVAAWRYGGQVAAANGRAQTAEAERSALKARISALERHAVVDSATLAREAHVLADAQAALIERAKPGDGAAALAKAFKAK